MILLDTSDDRTGTQVVASLLRRQLQLSLQAVGRAQAIAWAALSPSARARYMHEAETQLRKELER